MNILRASHLGWCFGVRDALEIARQEAATGPITSLGELVHNPAVLEDLRQRGVLTRNDPDDVSTKRVLITAHGTSKRRLQELADRGFEVTEATCPLVHRAHAALSALVRDGCHPVIIGLRGHVEVRGMAGDHPECDIILTEEDVDGLEARARFGVVSQTTQPIERVQALVSRLRTRFPHSEVVFRDTVCQPTKDRQNAAREIARRCDVVIVVGGAHSNNTRELVFTCRLHCPRVHAVQNASELRAEWFQPDDTVGLTAGTSTPDVTIAAVEEWLREHIPTLLPAHCSNTREVNEPAARALAEPAPQLLGN